MLVFDLESDGLLDDLTVIHCIVISDMYEGDVTRYRPYEVHEGARRLLDAVLNGEQICGHNIISFDIPAMEKVFPWFRIPRDKRHLIVDTLVMARLIYSNVAYWDAGLLRRGTLPRHLYESQSLEAWGYRLGEFKGTYGKQENAWDKYTEEMLEYNVQDVVVTERLLEKLLSKNYSQMAIDLEHEAQWLMAQQERNGFPFDTKAAEAFEVTLRSRYAILDAKLRRMVPEIPDNVFVPKRNNKTKGYIAGVPIQRHKDFNPGSGKQVEYVITKFFGYQPMEPELYDFKLHKGITDDAKLDLIRNGEVRMKIEDETFEFLKDDKNAPQEVRDISVIMEEYRVLSKRLGQLADGKQAWLKNVKADGMIHGSVNPNGAVTGRATHSKPNIAQVPKVGKPFGAECRALFGVPEGWIQCGVDASGLELRCLGHFMSPYDKGAYAHEVINGDIHTINQTAAGLPTRDAAKTFIYAYLYGAGDLLIGKQIGGGSKEGKQIKKEFLAKTPALGQLKQAIEDVLVSETFRGRVTKWKRKYLKGLDGRILWVRSLHSALNLLLQSAGALICKKWICRWEQRLVERGLKHCWDGDFVWMAWVHDEAQVACRTMEIAEIVKEEGQNAMKDTEEFFGFRVALSTEGKIGKTWRDCH